jgi:hypothetical protein
VREALQPAAAEDERDPERFTSGLYGGGAFQSAGSRSSHAKVMCK